MIRILNVLHYCFYKLHYRSHLIANYINPFRLIHKLPFLKRKYEDLGIAINEEVNQAFKNKEYRISLMFSGGMLVGSLFFFVVGILELITVLILGFSKIDKLIIVLIGLLSYRVCYVLVFRNLRYIKYFEEFEGWERKKEVYWMLISVFFVVFSASFFFYSLLYF